MARKEGVEKGIDALCQVLGIELTEDRRRELRELSAERLTALLGKIAGERRWP
jgi:hypothetical protein